MPLLRALHSCFHAHKPIARLATFCILLVGASLLGSAPAHSQEPASDSAVKHYLEVVRPLLKAKCYACHGALKAEAGLRLDTAELARTGGDSGSATDASPTSLPLLLRRVDSDADGTRMPIEGTPLDETQRQALATWLDAGAPGPADEAPETPPAAHWAFRPPQAHPTPAITSPLPDSEPRNRIDGFIQDRLAQSGLSPAPIASPEVQLRRVWLDLLGVPPTPDDLAEFLEDRRPDAFERVVDRLLASPRHGERWARHWMDIWRYADWHGRRMVPDVWNSAPQIWRWRDWIVNSANHDLGYDQMIHAMLAGDELHGEDPEQFVATGYLVRNWYALNPNDWMRSNVEHTARAFLGLSLHCAHCHDHKYDPLTQQDYFAFRAFFEPLGVRQDPLAGEEDPGPFQEYEYSTLRKVERRGTVSVYDRSPDAPTWRYLGGDERNRDEAAGPIQPAFPAFLGNQGVSITSIDLPMGAWLPAARDDLKEHRRIESQREITRRREAIEAADRAILEQESLAQARLEEAGQQHAMRLTADQDLPRIALSGQRSIRIDATQGRRILQRSFTSLEIQSGTTISFLVRIEREAHFNVQLAADAVQGATAAYVGFLNGKLMAYRPGSTEEIEIGTYQPSAEGSSFKVSLRLIPSDDVAELTIIDRASGQPMVSNVPTALNGWNPLRSPQRALSFDIRPGTIVVIDDLAIEHPTSDSTNPLQIAWKCDWEDDLWVTGGEVLGHEGWFGSTFDVAPATAQVVAYLPPAETLATAAQLEAARAECELLSRRREAAVLGLQVAESRATVGDRTFDDYLRQLDPPAPPSTAAPNEPASSSEADANEQQRIQAEMTLALIEAEIQVAEGFRQLDATARYTALSQATRQRLDVELRNVSNTPPASPLAGARSYPRKSTGRRTALAQWMTAPDQPLTARVAINHVWTRHFHAPLVATVDDFGRNGAPPSHPELLDRLAVELMERDWSLKDLHRRLITSRLYRTASSVGRSEQWQPHQQLDPDNRLWWRAQTGRMESEVVRDSLLATAEQLDLRLGGQELENDQAMTSNRRSLYFSCQPEVDGRSEFGALFDAPEALQCYRRTRSVMPQQALALTNSALVHRLSQQLADDLWNRAEQTPEPAVDFVERAFRQVLSRAPRSDEQQACLDFLARASDAAPENPVLSADQQARQGLVRALWNLNDFLTVR